MENISNVKMSTFQLVLVLLGNIGGGGEVCLFDQSHSGHQVVGMATVGSYLPLFANGPFRVSDNFYIHHQFGTLCKTALSGLF